MNCRSNTFSISLLHHHRCSAIYSFFFVLHLSSFSSFSSFSFFLARLSLVRQSSSDPCELLVFSVLLQVWRFLVLVASSSRGFHVPKPIGCSLLSLPSLHINSAFCFA